jgi:hypothetical protein
VNTHVPELNSATASGTEVFVNAAAADSLTSGPHNVVQGITDYPSWSSCRPLEWSRPVQPADTSADIASKARTVENSICAFCGYDELDDDTIELTA